ncbi:uncharacterized protein LOC124941839 [Impatiens glandulifera]|uniref:uncharacterized protein LOC124941839 n=1 Tax=Impatiens glandulifera TaxID=253017 RepID=UPI001FB0D18D|nr:uncharacterized protein LOC124941839 [Impatiens glandulifera]
MWLEIICCLVIYKLIRLFFYDNQDEILQVETSDSNASFSVAQRLEKLYGGKTYIGLRIPDADTGSHRDIDMVLVTKGEAVVISVQNMSGFVSVDASGNWVCIGNKTENFPDPVVEAKEQVSILESYLEQRGVSLPQGFLACKVICPNPKFQIISSSNSFPPEVVTYDQWLQLKPEGKTMFSGWLKNAFQGGKKETEESIHQKLNSILSTSPMWDRLVLKGNKYLLGEFLEFKGKDDDLLLLKFVKRSKINRVVIQMTSMFGLAPSRLQVLFKYRDYRNEGSSSALDLEEVTVRSNTEVSFLPKNSKKVRKIKLSSIISLHLSS